MDFNTYQQQALTTALYTGDDLRDLTHWVLGISGESGEVAEKLKKIIRDKKGIVSNEDRHEIAKEIGDVLWYLAVCAHHLGVPLEEIATVNLAKLADRKDRQQLQGSGDNR